MIISWHVPKRYPERYHFIIYMMTVIILKYTNRITKHSLSNLETFWSCSFIQRTYSNNSASVSFDLIAIGKALIFDISLWPKSVFFRELIIYFLLFEHVLHSVFILDPFFYQFTLITSWLSRIRMKCSIAIEVTGVKDPYRHFFFLIWFYISPNELLRKKKSISEKCNLFRG